MQDIQGTSAELLAVAGGNQDDHSFLLGYIASEVSPVIIREAILALLDHREQQAAYSLALRLVEDPPYDPRD